MTTSMNSTALIFQLIGAWHATDAFQYHCKIIMVIYREYEKHTSRALSYNGLFDVYGIRNEA